MAPLDWGGLPFASKLPHEFVVQVKINSTELHSAIVRNGFSWENRRSLIMYLQTPHTHSSRTHKAHKVKTPVGPYVLRRLRQNQLISSRVMTVLPDASWQAIKAEMAIYVQGRNLPSSSPCASRLHLPPHPLSTTFRGPLCTTPSPPSSLLA